MERFLKRHEGRIRGSISGFDRILFHGTFRTICYSEGVRMPINALMHQGWGLLLAPGNS